MLRTLVTSTVILLAVPAAAYAQSEAALKQALEGRSLVVRVDMPGSQLGIDVYPERSQPVDFGKVAQRIKESGKGVVQGSTETITTIKVKNDHIEIHLGGGGFGTFGDLLRSSQEIGRTGSASQGKTAQERDLENRIRRTTNSSEKRRLQRELDDLRAERARDNSRASADAALANRLAAQNERDLRTSSGSRFNVRFDGRSVPPEYLTPEGLLEALSRYGRLAGDDADAFDAPVTSAQAPARAADGKGITALHKEMTLLEAEAALGPASAVSSHDAGGLTVVERTYNVGERQVVARFVGDVLVEYLIQSR